MEVKNQKKQKKQKNKSKSGKKQNKQENAQLVQDNSNLNPNAAVFIPSFALQSSQSVTSTTNLNIQASVFIPRSKQGAQASSNLSEAPKVFPIDQLSQFQSLIQTQPSLQVPPQMSFAGLDPMNAYKNPYISNTAQAKLLQKKKEETQKEEQKKKIYTLEFMLSLRNENKDRPANMALFDFPYKKRKNQFGQQPSESDKFNQVVRELRILLNKLSNNNFDLISKQILQDYSFTPSLLNEMMKIIFMKATTESTYLELYVKLCILLFKKYNDKENKEMNFKKLLLIKCQKQFYKMQEKEEQEKRSRRESMANEEKKTDEEKGKQQNNVSLAQQWKQQVKQGGEGGGGNDESDFNKQMLFVFDQQEIQYRQKLQLYGNMRLIVELFVHNQIPEEIIQTCISTLLDDINDQNVEILCQMMEKISAFVIQSTLNREKREREKKKDNKASPAGPISSRPNYKINLQYIDHILHKIFSHRQDPLLTSRVKFIMQDLIDAYNREWKQIIFGERQMEDEEGFKYKYVPKDAIISEEQLGGPHKKSNLSGAKNRKQSKDFPNQFVYLKRSPKQSFDQNLVDTDQKIGGSDQKSNNSSQFKSPMQKLLQNLKPSDIIQDQEQTSDDEDVRKIVERKVSMNEQNVIGKNFEKYNNFKPSNEIKRKIMNYLEEFREGLLNVAEELYSEDDDEEGDDQGNGAKENKLRRRSSIQKKVTLAEENFLEICKDTGIQKFVFVGYIINHAYSLDQKGWNELISLVIDQLCSQQKTITYEELLEGVHVSLANFVDTLIDYPRSLEYSQELFEKLGNLGVLSNEMVQKYKTHVNIIDQQNREY